MKPIAQLIFKQWRPIVIAVSLLAAAGSYQLWWPHLLQLARDVNLVSSPATKTADPATHGHDHAPGGGHLHPQDTSHAAEDELTLSPTARKNVGLRTGIVEARAYHKTVAVPALVTERAGWTQLSVSAPLTGVVSRIYPIEGEAVRPGQALFDLRLTHEDLVTAQQDVLRSTSELEIVNRELARLEAVEEGVIAGKRLIEEQYKQRKLVVAIQAQTQALVLHGLSLAQIEELVASGRLLAMQTVVAPSANASGEDASTERTFHVQQIEVNRGQAVTAGQQLAVLADHGLLYVEGQAFGEDAERLITAASGQEMLEVSQVSGSGNADDSMRLRVIYVADHVDRESRALRFYLGLPNQLVLDEMVDGHRMVAWRFRPGQRTEVRIPIGRSWDNQVVLPAEAVVYQGVDAYVFEQHGEHFHRVAVHVLYQDKQSVVVENDGSLIGKTVAMAGAYQMGLALKNQTGGAMDPHAGHVH